MKGARQSSDQGSLFAHAGPAVVDPHTFGGHWTQAKLAALQAYLGVYTTALKAKFELHYFDGFAGTGTYVPKSGGGGAQLGSAMLALQYPFATYTFVDQKPGNLRRLSAQINGIDMAGKGCRVIRGDANEEAVKFCAQLAKGARAVMFLDPYGLHVEWSTLERIRQTEAVDLWYLFPLSGVMRQMTVLPSKRDHDKDAALDRVFGTDAWREDLYVDSASKSLFGEPAEAQRVTIEGVREWTTALLESRFPAVRLAAQLTRGARGNRFGGPQLFDLYFLCSNPSTRATALADRLVKGVTDALRKKRMIA
jgi:three-Cys-motif partner protein